MVFFLKIFIYFEIQLESLQTSIVSYLSHHFPGGMEIMGPETCVNGGGRRTQKFQLFYDCFVCGSQKTTSTTVVQLWLAGLVERKTDSQSGVGVCKVATWPPRWNSCLGRGDRVDRFGRLKKPGDDDVDG